MEVFGGQKNCGYKIIDKKFAVLRERGVAQNRFECRKIRVVAVEVGDERGAKRVGLAHSIN